LTEETIAAADTSQSTPAPETTEQTTVEVPDQTADQTSEGHQEDSFFDPNQVPEELKPAYKQMQADYTRKTQEIAAIRKEHEALKGKQDQYAKFEQFLPILEEMNAQKGAQDKNPEIEFITEELKKQGYDDSSIDAMTVLSKSLLNVLNQREAQKEQSKQGEWVNSQIQEAGKVDPRLNDAKLVYTTADGEQVTFGSMVEQLVNANPDWRKDPVASTKKAIARIDALIGQAKVEGKEELSQSAQSKAKRFPATHSSSQGATATDRLGDIKSFGHETAKELGIKY